MQTKINTHYSSIIVGIDFGTTNSLVTYQDNNEIKFIKFNDCDMIESIVGYTENSKYFGTQAKDCEYVFRYIKRIFSDPTEAEDNKYYNHTNNGIPYFKINNEDKSCIDIAADLFKYLRHTTNKQLNDNICNAVISIPTRYNEIQKQWTIEAATKAGWKVIRLITEPVASLFAMQVQNGIYGVYDWGGGTFDFSVIKIHNGVHQVLGSCGDLKLGGEYYYNVWLEFFRQKYNKDFNIYQIRKLFELMSLQIINPQQIALEVTALSSNEDIESNLEAICVYLQNIGYDAKYCEEFLNKTHNIKLLKYINRQNIDIWLNKRYYLNKPIRNFNESKSIPGVDKSNWIAIIWELYIEFWMYSEGYDPITDKVIVNCAQIMWPDKSQNPIAFWPNYYIEKAIHLINELISSLNIKLDKIFCIGGMFNVIKSVMLESYFINCLFCGSESQSSIIIAEDLQKSVAKGVAIYANQLVQKESVYLLLDIAPMSVGIEVANGMTEWIIEKNSPLPARGTIECTNMDENQTHIIFKIIQGEGNIAKHSLTIGEFDIEIDPKPVFFYKIQLEFTLNVDGMLYIEALNQNNGEIYKINFKSGQGLTEDMIARILNNAKHNVELSDFYKLCKQIDIILSGLASRDTLEYRNKRNTINDVNEAQNLLKELETKFQDHFNDALKNFIQQKYEEKLILIDK